MASIDVNIWKSCIHASMKKHIPGFDPVHNDGLDRRSVLYHCECKAGFTAFLFFSVIPKSMRFNVDAAWSFNHEFPIMLPFANVVGNHLQGITPDTPSHGEFRFRVRDLWEIKQNASWAFRHDDCQVIDGIIEKIACHIIPYLKQLDPSKPGGWQSLGK